MSRAALLLILTLALAAAVRAQNPSPGIAPKAPTKILPAASAPPPPAATPLPTATPTVAQMVDALAPEDLQQAVPLLKSNYLHADAFSETELDRATLEGLLARLGRGVMLLPGGAVEEAAPVSPFHAEILEGHIGYLRIGQFTKSALREMDANLATYAAQNLEAVVIDLRASPQTNDFALAADFAKRFCPKGKPLFTLRKPGAKQEIAFTADEEPAFRGVIIVLTDGDTAGAPEAVAGVLQDRVKAMVIGQPTAGRAVEFADVKLPSGKIMRVAVAEAVLPEGQRLFPGGVKPDLPVEMSKAEKWQIFEKSTQTGVAPFVFETDRPHMNEAALQAGTNPELEAMQSAQQRRGRGPEKAPLRDLVLQRAVDLVTSISIFKKQGAP